MQRLTAAGRHQGPPPGPPVFTVRAVKDCVPPELLARIYEEPTQQMMMDAQADVDKVSTVVHMEIHPVIVSIVADFMERVKACKFLGPNAVHNGGTCMCISRGKAVVNGERVRGPSPGCDCIVLRL